MQLPDAQVGPALPRGEDLPQEEAFVPVPLGEPPPWLIWFVGGVLVAAAGALLLVASGSVISLNIPFLPLLLLVILALFCLDRAFRRVNGR